MGMLRNFCRVAMFTMLFSALSLMPAQGQAVPAAYGLGDSVWAGVEYSNFRASFPYQSGQRIQGLGAFADFHLKNRLGIEGNARFSSYGGFEGSTERTYLAGPKFFFLAPKRFWPYGKLMAGEGRIHYPFAIGDANYFVLAPGAGAEYSLGRRWMVRGDYEYQLWSNSPGYPNEPHHRLTPNGFHLGIAYRIFR